jgi:glycosyltransferase involved in cell wall biosynthesis
MDTMKNIIFLVSSLKVGGAEKILADLITGLTDYGYKPYLVCLKNLEYWGEFLNKKKIHCHTLGFKWHLDVPKLINLIQITRSIQPSLVYSLDHRDAIIIGRILSRILNIPHVSSQHSLKILGAEARDRFIYKFLLKFTTPLTSKIIAVGDSVKRSLLDFGVAPDKIEVIYNGVSSKNHQNSQSGSLWRNRLGLCETDKLVGIVAALRPTKSLDTFLKAAKIVLNDCKNTHFAIVGDGYLLTPLRKLSKSLNISDHVFFLGNVTPALSVINAFDIGVLSSLQEAFPMVILEYMQAGKPVVATENGGPSEIVTDGKTGYLVPSKDFHQLAQKIIYLLKNEQQAEKMGFEGKNCIEKYFTLDKMIKKNVKLFDVLTSSK